MTPLPCHSRRGSQREPREGGPGSGGARWITLLLALLRSTRPGMTPLLSPDPSDRPDGYDTTPVSPPARLATRASGRGPGSGGARWITLPLALLRSTRPGMTPLLSPDPSDRPDGYDTTPVSPPARLATRASGRGTRKRRGKMDYPSPRAPSDRSAGYDTVASPDPLDRSAGYDTVASPRAPAERSAGNDKPL